MHTQTSLRAQLATSPPLPALRPVTQPLASRAQVPELAAHLFLPAHTFPDPGGKPEFSAAATLLSPHARHAVHVVDVSDLAPGASAWRTPRRSVTAMTCDFSERQFARLHATPALIAVCMRDDRVRPLPRRSRGATFPACLHAQTPHGPRTAPTAAAYRAWTSARGACVLLSVCYSDNECL